MKKTSVKELRTFSFIWAFIFIVVATIPLLKDHNLLIWAVITSILFVVVGIVAPQTLRVFHKYWTLFGELIGGVISKLIMIILFYLIFTPISLFLKVLKKDLLKKKLDKTASTYWIDRDDQPGSLKNQF